MKNKKTNRKLLAYLCGVLLVFIGECLLLGFATLIVCNDALRTAFNNFYAADAMTWNEAKDMLITGYILSPFYAALIGLPVSRLWEEEV